VLPKLTREYRSLQTDSSRLDGWWSRIKAWQDEYPLTYEPGTDGEIKPQYMIQAMHKVTGGEAIVTSRIMTPLDFRDRLMSYKGAAFSFEPVLTQSARFRPHNRSEDIEGLFLVGAGTHPGAGVPGVLSSARVLDRIVPDASVFA